MDTTAVLTIRADGTHLVQMTPSSMIAGDCDWSPDGKRLVFISHPLVSFNFDPVVSNLFTVRPDGSGLRQLTHSTTSNHRATQAHFTPDGHIIYTRVTPGGRTLWLINADGSNGTPIPASGELIPDARRLAVARKLRTKVSRTDDARNDRRAGYQSAC